MALSEYGRSKWRLNKREIIPNNITLAELKLFASAQCETRLNDENYVIYITLTALT